MNKEKMNKDEKIILVLLIFIILAVFTSAFVIADNGVSYCCEKTVQGAYCQNVPNEEMCDSGVKNPETGEKYGVTPSACGSTSYCQVGCCYDSDEGVCFENTPREACRVGNGQWTEQSDCNIAQCDLGCCLIGTEAAYVTLARCKKLAGQYGVGLDFRNDVQNELSCIALATSQDLGACVYEQDFVNTCKFGTRGDCNANELGEGINATSVTFYKDYLCSAEQFNTDCGPSESTRCEDGKVYFEDTCGNRANVYDSRKMNNRAYWTKLVSDDELCEGSPRNCGNCEYLGQGTICGEAERGEQPAIGEYICKDVNCYDTYNGNDYKNGESWCVYDNDNPGEDSVGSRHFRHICFMGEEIVEPCSDFRQEVCFEDTIGEEEDFSQAGCGANRWEDCTTQENQKDCLNTDKRDCVWLPIDDEFNLLANLGGATVSETQIDREVARRLARMSQLEPSNLVNRDEELENSVCVPRYSPGLKFWDEGNSEEICKQADSSCVVKYEKKLLGGDWECVENCWCKEPETEVTMALMCSKLGDCGPGFNYLGDYVNEGYTLTVEKSKTEPIQETQPAEPTRNTDTRTFGGSADPVRSGGPATPTGGVIRDFVVKSYNQVVK
jgi:hypothetical protein